MVEAPNGLRELSGKVSIVLARAVRCSPSLLPAVVLVLGWTVDAGASELIEARIASDLVPSPVEYAVLLPDGYDADGDPLPLLFSLHGGGRDRSMLARLRPVFEEAWSSGRVPPMVVVTPSVSARGFYVDRRDGSEKWETFLVGPFLNHLRESYNVRRDRAGTLLTGISMGGQGSLRMAFKYPEKFGAVAALEPGIDPGLRWGDVQPKHRFWRSDALLEAAYGSPIDEEYWAANNPATIADRDPERLRASGLWIYLECGDEDMFWLYEAAEFLHQVLYRHSIRHEYHLVYGADHVGGSVRARLIEGLEFLARSMSAPDEDPAVEAGRRRIDFLKGRVGVEGQGHLEPRP